MRAVAKREVREFREYREFKEFREFRVFRDIAHCFFGFRITPQGYKKK